VYNFCFKETVRYTYVPSNIYHECFCFLAMNDVLVISSWRSDSHFVGGQSSPRQVVAVNIKCTLPPSIQSQSHPLFSTCPLLGTHLLSNTMTASCDNHPLWKNYNDYEEDINARANCRTSAKQECGLSTTYFVLAAVITSRLCMLSCR